jgi:squalene cyclase
MDNAARTERAVTNALSWLRDHQLENGSWAGQEPVAMTGLALLAYLAHAEVPGSGPYGDTVTRGLKFLIAAQNDRGVFSRNVYAHAIATYAVSEAFTLTRIVELRTSMEKAVQVIIQGQQDRGGFDYHYDKGTRFDTSVAGWQIQALKAASLAGAAQPSLDTALAKATRFLQNDAFARDGSGFVYEGINGIPATGGARWTMTGVGTLCLQLLGQPSSSQVRLGLKALREVTFDWLTDAKPSLYGYYYVTQARFQQDNRAAWQDWNARMQGALLKHQHTDGHWENGDYDQGSHVYTTTLCTLMLEVYYRYLPTFVKAPEKPIQTGKSTEDVSVDVH